LGAGQSGLALALGTHAHHVPREPTGLQAPDDERGPIELPAVEAVGRRGREGVVVAVPGLAEGKTWQIELMLNVT
jgi:hypothetical protein